MKMSEIITLDLDHDTVRLAAKTARLGATEQVRERILVSRAVSLAIRNYIDKQTGHLTVDGRAADIRYGELLDVNDFAINNWFVEIRALTNVAEIGLYVPTVPLMVGFLSHYYVCAKVDVNLSKVDVFGFASPFEMGSAELSTNGLMAHLPTEELKPLAELIPLVSKPRLIDPQALSLFDDWQERAARLSGTAETLLTDPSFSESQVERLAAVLYDEVLRMYSEVASPTGFESLFAKLTDRFNFDDPIRSRPESPLIFANTQVEKKRINASTTVRKFFRDQLNVVKRIGLYRHLVESKEAFAVHRQTKQLLDLATDGNAQSSRRRRDRVRRSKQDHAEASLSMPVPPPAIDPVETAEVEEWFSEFDGGESKLKYEAETVEQEPVEELDRPLASSNTFRNMPPENFADRFDKFQKVAVNAICNDFKEKVNGRFLLVIPTGGGKTFTAVKSINTLYESGILNSEDRVLWTAHRVELISQAKDTFIKYEERFPHKPSYKENVDFKMIGAVNASKLRDPKTKLVVIDEAHHGAANSYVPIFERTNLGILGLTATPTRHDGKPLEFERESFSVGFPDLVEMGVVLRPEVRTIEGGTYYFSFSDENEGLEELNNAPRNQRIIGRLLDKNEDYNKVIIYVGTKNHVYSLYRELNESSLKGRYESISYVTGEGNSRGQNREDYFSQEKKYKRSIIVNVDVLTEGYDDPSINTVVMARPTSSKLIYMQSMGRAIRHDPNNDLKRAYILEVVDDLPNIRYRIDNRWLYSDISDALEPAVIDREFSSLTDFEQVLDQVYSEFNVPESSRLIPSFREHNRYTLLLFKVYQGGNEKYFHHPILIDNDNRAKVSNLFNFISERMAGYRARAINPEQVFRMIDFEGIRGLESESLRLLVFKAMENSMSDEPIFNEGRPWITFATFRFNQDENEIPNDTLEFISELVNRDEILEQLKAKEYVPNSYLVRYPLPLSWFIGKIVPPYEFEAIQNVVKKIEEIKRQHRNVDHRQFVDEILHYAVLPVEPIYSQSLVQIARDDTKYFIPLS